jgi:hypothetical protein
VNTRIISSKRRAPTICILENLILVDNKYQSVYYQRQKFASFLTVQIGLGFKAHSGWAAFVAIGKSTAGLVVVDRRRIELIDDGELWAKQPYHAAEGLPKAEARKTVHDGIKSARRVAKRRLKDILQSYDEGNYKVAACAVVTPHQMPGWSTDEILAVHIRMHKAEGVLFPDALARAAEVNKLQLVTVNEKNLGEIARKVLGKQLDRLMDEVSALGRSVGPPWNKDQKLATIAAMIALKQFS